MTERPTLLGVIIVLGIDNGLPEVWGRVGMHSERRARVEFLP